MKVDEFFTEAAKRRTAETIKAIEARTAGEAVVAVRAASGEYRHTDYLVGFAASLLALIALLFLPVPFAIETWPLEVGLAFAAGALVCSSVSPLKRALTSSRTMANEVARSARAAFVDMGISRTRDRSGLLVFVSLLERRAEVVADAGLDVLEDDAELARARTELDASLADGPDLERFLKALADLGDPLARALPRRADDVNELGDEVRE